MNWPQITVIVLLAMAAGLNTARATGWRERSHGKETNNFYAARTFIQPAFWVAILHFGGFWS